MQRVHQFTAKYQNSWTWLMMVQAIHVDLDRFPHGSDCVNMTYVSALKSAEKQSFDVGQFPVYFHAIVRYHNAIVLQFSTFIFLL